MCAARMRKEGRKEIVSSSCMGDRKRIGLCVLEWNAGSRTEKKCGYEPAVGGVRNARPWQKRVGWRVEYVHSAAAS